MSDTAIDEMGWPWIQDETGEWKVMSDKPTISEWTADYVEKLELNYGWEGVAHNHNAALAAEREQLKLMSNMYKVCCEQRDAERHKREACEVLIRDLQKELAQK
jgi:hypothetical protein